MKVKMKKELPKGSIVALVTPYDDYGKVNYKEIKRLIEWHKSQGTAGLVVFGTTGESCCLSDIEKEKNTDNCVGFLQRRPFRFCRER